MSEQRAIFLPVIGSLFGVATGFFATYNIIGSFFGGQDTPTSQLLIESGLWTLWVGLQGIGFYIIYTRNRESIFAGTGVIGLLTMVLEVITVSQIWNAIEDFAFSLIGILTTTLYILMAGYSMTLLRPNDSLDKITGYTFIVTGVVLLAFPPAGFALLGFSNLLAFVLFMTLDSTSQPIAQPTSLSLE